MQSSRSEVVVTIFRDDKRKNCLKKKPNANVGVPVTCWYHLIPSNDPFIKQYQIFLRVLGSYN